MIPRQPNGSQATPETMGQIQQLSREKRSPVKLHLQELEDRLAPVSVPDGGTILIGGVKAHIPY